MFKTMLFFLFFVSSITVIGQVTFIVNNYPEKTADTSAVFISGDFEGWSGGRDELKLIKQENIFSITIPKFKEHISFKFTQGSWDRVECDENGSAIENRTYSFNKPYDTVYVSIQKWNSLENRSQPKVSTAAKNVFIFSENFEIPQLNRFRSISIYLPPNYKETNERYPVLYMLDGQNMFDLTTSYAGEWEVDETLNTLYEKEDMSFIVIAIGHGGENRTNEYSAWNSAKHGTGEGELFLDFIVNTLKPEIDQQYRTKPDNINTAIIGSSMGGLFAHYTALKRPDVFGKAVVFSPSFWYAKDCFSFTTERINSMKESKLYYLAGNKEGAGMVENMDKMISLLLEGNIRNNNIYKSIIPNGTHNESLWRTGFNNAVLWLFSK